MKRNLVGKWPQEKLGNQFIANEEAPTANAWRFLRTVSTPRILGTEDQPPASKGATALTPFQF